MDNKGHMAWFSCNDGERHECTFEYDLQMLINSKLNPKLTNDSPKLIEKYIKAIPSLIMFTKYKSAQICDIAVKYDAKNLKYVPESMLTNATRLQIIKNDVNYIKNIPFSKQTKEIFEVVKRKIHDAELIKYVDPKFQDCEFICICLGLGDTEMTLKYTREDLKTPECYGEYIGYYYDVYKFIPKELHTEKMLLNSWWLPNYDDYDNKELLTSDFYEKFTSKHRCSCDTLKEIPKELQTQKILLKMPKIWYHLEDANIELLTVDFYIKYIGTRHDELVEFVQELPESIVKKIIAKQPEILRTYNTLCKSMRFYRMHEQKYHWKIIDIVNEVAANHNFNTFVGHRLGNDFGDIDVVCVNELF